MDSKIIGIDLAKRVFQLCAVSATNKVIFNRKLSWVSDVNYFVRSYCRSIAGPSWLRRWPKYHPSWSPWKRVQVRIIGAAGFRRWVDRENRTSIHLVLTDGTPLCRPN